MNMREIQLTVLEELGYKNGQGKLTEQELLDIADQTTAILKAIKLQDEYDRKIIHESLSALKNAIEIQ